MKRILIVLPAMFLGACASHRGIVTENQPVIYPKDAWSNNVPADSVQNVRDPSEVHTYIVNPYQDPNNPNVRHDGHNVTVLDKSETWNLRPTDTTYEHLGPVTAVADPSAAPNPYSAEFETELVKQREQSQQLSEIGNKMVEQMGKLQQATDKAAALAEENDEQKQQLAALQQQVDVLKAPPVKPAPAQSGVWDTIKGMFPKAKAKDSNAVPPTTSFKATVPPRDDVPAEPAPAASTSVAIDTQAPPLDQYTMSPQEEQSLAIHQSAPVGDQPPLPAP